MVQRRMELSLHIFRRVLAARMGRSLCLYWPFASGTYTVLVWCEAFSVEFVGATVTV